MESIMKKIILISALILAAALSGCGKKQQDHTEVTPPPVVPSEIAEAVTGETKDFSQVSVSDDTLTGIIKKINKNAVVSSSANPGSKMLMVNLPIKESDSLPENFIDQVEDIVDEADLDENSEYSYFYFSTGEDDNIYISASFKKTETGISLDKLNTMDEKYTDGVNKAVADSDLFTEGEN